MFVLQGQAIVESPLDVVRIAIPLTIYFALMFVVTFYAAWRLGPDYSRSTSVACSDGLRQKP